MPSLPLEYETEGGRRIGHLALPETAEAAPGVLVLHGGGGLGPHAKARADLLAQLGYVAFAPDLFGHRVEGLEAAEALTGRLVEDLTDLRARCAEGLDVLRARPEVDARRLAAIGFCFGGQAAIELARGGHALRAVVAFHARLHTARPEDSVRISGAVLACLGDSDRFVPREERDAFLENMTASGVDCQMLLFSGVSHGFTDRNADASGIPGLRYDARADRRAWSAMRSLLDEVFAS